MVSQNALHLDTVYGKVTIEDPLTQKLIASPSFQRLKGVHQYGVVPFVYPTESFSRFDHSLGVYHLLQKIDAPYEECVAGLLHDVSHTVFSHVGDYVFQGTQNTYQDEIYSWYLKSTEIENILTDYGLNPQSIHPKNPHFSALDKPLPFLCADRIEYNLQGGLLRGVLTKEQFHSIYHALQFQNGVWFLTDPHAAKHLGMCSLKMTESLWSSAWEGLLYRTTADALKRAFEIEQISFEEFHFSTDEHVWNKLLDAKDPLIEQKMKMAFSIKDSFTLTESGQEDLLLKLKFRGVDPLVGPCFDQLTPLTELDGEFARAYKQLDNYLNQGYPIKFFKDSYAHI